mgnify:CR=1 FL=1
MLFRSVHDENARFLGGVSGNAGVFSTMDDLALFVQMLAAEGELPDGSRYLCPATVRLSMQNRTPGMAQGRGLGFALPISSVSFVVNDLIAHGEFLGTPTIGITVRTIEKSGGGTQVEVYTVDDALGAAEAGVQPGDIILEADGQPVSVTSDLLTVRRSHSVGDTIRLTIQRDGQSLTVDVVLYASK